MYGSEVAEVIAAYRDAGARAATHAAMAACSHPAFAAPPVLHVERAHVAAHRSCCAGLRVCCCRPAADGVGRSGAQQLGACCVRAGGRCLEGRISGEVLDRACSAMVPALW